MNHILRPALHTCGESSHHSFLAAKLRHLNLLVLVLDLNQRYLLIRDMHLIRSFHMLSHLACVDLCSRCLVVQQVLPSRPMGHGYEGDVTAVRRQLGPLPEVVLGGGDGGLGLLLRDTPDMEE